MPRIGVFPGQFDPITNGHLDVIRRGVVLFDELIVAVGNNPEKRDLFSLDERLEMVRELVGQTPGVRVEKYAGLTVDVVRRCNATAILRGIRDVSDLRYEFQALTSSSLIRQVVALGGGVEQLASILPDLVIDRLRDKQKQLAGTPIEPDAPAA
jgi:pantetheine-phosphate adenylyltransferase